MARPAPVLGVSACLFADGRILLVERGREPYRGRLSLPGGRVEYGESLEAAARREVLEETGLTLDRLVFATLHEAIGEDVHAVIAVHSGALPADTPFLAGDDARSLHLLPIRDLDALEAAGRTTPGLAAIVRRLTGG